MAGSKLRRLLRRGRNVRAIGFDDGPFERERGSRVPLCGVVCAGTRFEGMVWGHVRKDGWGATRAIEKLLAGGKFLPQSHLVLLDGIAIGGFNVVDLPRLAERLERPCVAVMRRPPDMAAVERAIRKLPRPETRLNVLRRAGDIHERGGFVFQAAGADPDDVAEVLATITDTGHVPEPLRLAHLIAGAVVTGESGRRA